MKLMLYVLVCFLSGCMYQSVTVNEIENGKTICMKREGLAPVEYSATFLGEEAVTCTNGASYRIRETNLR